MPRLLQLATLIPVLLVSAAGSAWAAPGDIYLGAQPQVFRVPAGAGSAQLVSSDPDFVSANSLEFAPDGRLFVLDYDAFSGNTGGLLVLDPATGQATPFVGGPPFSQPDGMALGPDGNMYVTDLSTPAIFRVDLNTAAVSTVSSGGLLAGGSLGIAVEPSTGRIFVGSNNGILAVDPQTGAQSVFSTGASAPGSLAALTRLPDGILGAVDYGNGRVYRVDPASGTATQIAPDSSLGAYDITHDLDGNLIVAGGSSVAAARYDAQTGASSIVAPAPPGSYVEGVTVEPPLCEGKTPTIAGTTKSEIITASPFPDVIAGLGGNDVINGLGGDGLICAGSGDDTVDGGDGNDQLLGEDGDDTLNAGGGNDNMTGGAGSDRENGGAGKDALIGESGRDRLIGGKGKDRLVGGTGKDKLVGGKGKDKLVGGKGKDKLVGGKGKDRLVGGRGRDTLNCGPGNKDVALADRKDRVRRSCETVK